METMPDSRASLDPPPIDLGSVDPDTVVEFGPQAPRAGRRRFNPTSFLSGFAADRRLVPLAAALAAVAVFASLVSEWQVTDVDATLLNDGQVGTRPLPTGLADLGAWGGGYLAGVFVLAAATVLTLFGPLGGRKYARLTGLSTAGVLLGLLVAMASDLDTNSRALGQVFMVQLTDEQVHLSYGRGLWCAFFGIAAALAALILAGRIPSDEAAVVVRAPRRRSPEPATDEPFELTVGPAKPFSAGDNERDKRISE
jgi:hypothetical protein